MKFLAVVFAAILMSSMAFANHHEEKKVEEGHDKEHTHVTKQVDHTHVEEHHTESADAHKAHHPDHVEKKSSTTTTTKKTK